MSKGEGPEERREEEEMKEREPKKVRRRRTDWGRAQPYERKKVIGLRSGEYS